MAENPVRGLSSIVDFIFGRGGRVDASVQGLQTVDFENQITMLHNIYVARKGHKAFPTH